MRWKEEMNVGDKAQQRNICMQIDGGNAGRGEHPGAARGVLRLIEVEAHVA